MASPPPSRRRREAGASHPRWGAAFLIQTSLILQPAGGTLRGSHRQASAAPLEDVTIREAVALYLEDETLATDTYGPIEGWDTGEVTDMSLLFSGRYGFNADLESWDVSSVTNFSGTFEEAYSFDGSLEFWDVSSAVDMSNMFRMARDFNGTVGTWDTRSVLDMSGMFEMALGFNQSLGGWDTSGVVSTRQMFRRTLHFAGKGIENWNTSSVKDMTGMFYYANIFDGNISGWDVSNVEDAHAMFGWAPSFAGDLSGWDVSSLIYAMWMFVGAASFAGDGLAGWDTRSLVKMQDMFSDAISFNQTLCWDLSSERDLTDDRYTPPLGTGIDASDMFCGSGGSFDKLCVDQGYVDASTRDCDPTHSPPY